MEFLASYCSTSEEDEETHPPGAEPARSDSPVELEHGEHSLRAARKRPAAALPDVETILDDDLRASVAPFGGRVRQFAHVEGDFNALVYLPVETCASLAQQLSAGIARLAPLSATPVHRISDEELHISLSRSFTLRRAQIAPFTEALSKALKPRRALHLCADAIHILANESRSCYFGAFLMRAKATADNDEARALLAAVNGVLSTFEKPPFYADAILHFSIAWSLSPFAAFRADAMPRLAHTMRPNRVLCKIGTRIVEYPLKEA